MLQDAAPATEIDPKSTSGQAHRVTRRTKDIGPAIARRLRLAREAAGLTQRELATRAHTSPTTIVTLERGEGGNSGVGLLVDLSKALGCRPAWLAFGDGEGPKEVP